MARAMLRRGHQQPAFARLGLRQFFTEHRIFDGVARARLQQRRGRRDTEQVDDRRQIVSASIPSLPPKVPSPPL